MDRDTIIQLAREAGLTPPPLDWPQKYAEALERFAALVAAHEQEEVRRLYRENQFLKHDLYDCAKACEQIAAAEREECARICDTWPTSTEYTHEIATAIRSRT